MKYIMFLDKLGRRFPVIFPDELVHANVAEAIQTAVRQGELEAGLTDWSCPEPITAGSIDILCVGTHGHSETLSLKSEYNDRVIINVYDYDKGVDTGMNAHVERLVAMRSIQLMMDQLKT